MVEDDLIDRIHEASVIPTLLPEVLRLFVKVAEGREGALIATNGEWYKWVGYSNKLAALEADILVSHQAPSSHRYGHAEIAVSV